MPIEIKQTLPQVDDSPPTLDNSDPTVRQIDCIIDDLVCGRAEAVHEAKRWWIEYKARKTCR